MNRRRGFTILVVGLFLSSLLSTFIVFSMRTSADDQYSYLEANHAINPRYRKLTSGEVSLYKTMIGVRDENRNYNVLIDGHGTGFAPPSDEEWDRIAQEVSVLAEPPIQPMWLPSSMDLATNPTFPKVGNQGGQGSCSAWAATYYTYGYLEATDNGWINAKSGTTSQLVSPAWTYNKVNGGSDSGSWMGDNMRIIKDWGVPTLATMPYSDKDPIGWGSQAAFREAPLHRGSDVKYLSGMSPFVIDNIKSVVFNGTPVTFAMDAYQFNRGFSDGNLILSAKEYSSWTLNHAQTVVGWDDSITDDGEVGAFRVVNSWGQGWGDGGYYWMTYDAFEEIGSMGLLFLTYMDDLPDYVPSMLAIWHFNNAPRRSTEPKIGLGDVITPIRFRVPYFERDGSHTFPTFMALDITEFQTDYNTGSNTFFLSLGSTSPSGMISSFKVELYEGAYVPGVASQTSGQSWSVPKTNPGDVSNLLNYYSMIPKGEAVDYEGMWFTSTTLVEWVGVNHHSNFGGDSIQSGDVGDSARTNLQTIITGPCALWFDWKVSSEPGADLLNFSDNGFVVSSISGEVDWTTVKYMLTDGPHVLEWEYVKDTATSQGMDTAWIDNFVIDTGPPVTSIKLSGNSGDNGWFNGAVTVGLTAVDENGTGVDYTEYRIDNGPWVRYSTNFIIMDDGVYKVEYHSMDFAGHDETIREMYVSIDTLIPNTIMNLNGVLGINGWYTSPVSITMFASDVTSGVNWTAFRINGGNWQYYDRTFQISADGLYTIDFMSRDNSGNTEPMHSLVVKLDGLGPTTTWSSQGTQGDNGWFISEVDVSIDATDEWSGVAWTKYRVNHGLWQSYTGYITLHNDGVHSIEFNSQDNAGTVETIQTTTIKIDKTVPELKIEQASGMKLNRNYLTISWSASDETSGLDRIETKIDNKPFVRHEASVTSIRLTGLSDGTHVFTVIAIDRAGKSTQRSIDFLIDRTPPVTTAMHFGTHGRGQWYVSSVDVSLAAFDMTTGIRETYYSINGGVWQRYLEPFHIHANGVFVVEFYSIDMLSNTENAKSIELNIDFFAPELWLLYTDVDKNSSTVDVKWHTADYESGLDYAEVSFDGNPFIPADSLTSIVQYLPEGSHTFIIRVVDQAGNAIDKQYSVLVTKPTTTLEVETATGPTVNMSLIGVVAILATLTFVVLAAIVKSQNSGKSKVQEPSVESPESKK